MEQFGTNWRVGARFPSLQLTRNYSANEESTHKFSGSTTSQELSVVYVEWRTDSVTHVTHDCIYVLTIPYWSCFSVRAWAVGSPVITEHAEGMWSVPSLSAVKQKSDGGGSAADVCG